MTIALLVATAACSGSSGADTLRVSAAASLGEAFTALAENFEEQHAGVDVVFNFAASSALARQVVDGAPVDIFASADEATMQQVVDADRAAEPTIIARNRLALLVETGNPRRLRGLADLDQRDARFVMCAPQVPCGRFAAAALVALGVRARPASLEENVKAAVTRVTLREADAAIVYATDVRAAADQADGVAVEDRIAADPAYAAVYSMAAVEDGGEETTRAWIEYVTSPEGQRTLARFGFLSP